MKEGKQNDCINVKDINLVAWVAVQVYIVRYFPKQSQSLINLIFIVCNCLCVKFVKFQSSKSQLQFHLIDEVLN